MNLLYLVQDPGIRQGAQKGAAVHVTAMCTAFANHGVHVHTVFSANEPETWSALDHVASKNFDLVYERYSLGAYAGSEWAHRRGWPHVLEVNAPLADEVARWRPESQVLTDARREVQAFGRAALCLCVSEPVAEYAMAHGSPEARTWVAPNGVDAQLFRPRSDRETWPSSWFPHLVQPMVLGFHGRLRPWHGLQRIAEACALALEKSANIAFVCVGKGSFDEALAPHLPKSRYHLEGWFEGEELARRVGAFDVVPFGYDPAAPCYFSPLKLREAMAAGAVPIVPDLGCLPETVRDGDTGRVYPAGSMEALAGAIVDLAKDQATRFALSTRARSSALEHTWDSIAHQVLSRTVGVAP